jgi:hypothetical protein
MSYGKLHTTPPDYGKNVTETPSEPLFGVAPFLEVVPRLPHEIKNNTQSKQRVNCAVTYTDMGTMARG